MITGTNARIAPVESPAIIEDKKVQSFPTGSNAPVTPMNWNNCANNLLPIPAAMNRLTPLPIPHFWTTSSMKKISSPPMHSWNMTRPAKPGKAGIPPIST